MNEPLTDSELLRHLLAELIRLQRWMAGGDSLDAKLHGLLAGADVETEPLPIVTGEKRRKFEDVLDDLDRGRLTMGYAFKDRLQTDAIDELELYRYARYCAADDRFAEATKLLGRSATPTSIEREWLGPSIYMELVDCTDDQRSKMHTVYAPTVPRIGETITPESGEPMKVIGIDYEIHPFGKSPHNHFRLVPAVLLEPVPDDEPLPPPN